MFPQNSNIIYHVLYWINSIFFNINMLFSVSFNWAVTWLILVWYAIIPLYLLFYLFCLHRYSVLIIFLDYKPNSNLLSVNSHFHHLAVSHFIFSNIVLKPRNRGSCPGSHTLEIPTLAFHQTCLYTINERPKLSIIFTSQSIGFLIFNVKIPGSTTFLLKQGFSWVDRHAFRKSRIGSGVGRGVLALSIAYCRIPV